MTGIAPTRGEQLSINTATLGPRCNLRQAVDALQRQGIGSIAPWRDRIAEFGLAQAARLIRDAGLTVTGLCRGGMFTGESVSGRLAAIEDNRRAIDEAAALDAACLVIVSGGLPAGSRDLPGARAMVRDGLAAILDHARATGVRIAIEPLHPMTAADRCCINTLGQALDLCDELDADKSRGLGVAVDVYHVWWDPQLYAQIERAGAARLLAFHLCDWLVPTRDLVLDRGMMGDGAIDLKAIRACMEAAGYRGLHEVEIFSQADWWQREPDDILRVCRARHREVC
jgi:sugar phosphate isomerase/epimerase